MGNQFHTPEFLALQSKWYEVLSKDGFENIEDSKGRLANHKQFVFLTNKTYRSVTKEITESYYAWASEQVHIGVFKCARDRMAWGYHTDGFTGTQIAYKMGFKNRKWINRVLQKVRKYLKLASN